MTAQGPRMSSEARRRYLALSVAGGMALVFALGIALRPHSPGHPSAQGTASPGVTASARPAAVPSQDREAAKLAAEADGAANPRTDTASAQLVQQQPSWNAKPKVVRYHGYQLQVPGSWPVYNLSALPSQCVLFSNHAVYLGTPSSTQNCPASAIGRTESLLIEPASAASIPGAAIRLTGGGAALPERTALPAAADDSHLFQVEVPRAGVLVTATYGSSESRLRALLAGATIAGRTTTRGASYRSPGASKAASLAGSGVPMAARQKAHGTQAVLTAAANSLVTSSATSGQASPLRPMTGSGLGFDTCTVPTISVMRSWLSSPYRVIGTYLGGMNWACGYGNFSASWVRQAAAEGWRFAPLWVGRQAPCTATGGVALINPARAAAQGEEDANGAVAAAQRFGYGRGSPIYFDMESYRSNRSCRTTVLTFLSGWTKALHAAGYASGVYSGAASGMEDLAGVYKQGGYARPDDIWIALWNGRPLLTDHYVPDADWANHQRLDQYSGPHSEKWGGAKQNIDTDAADGPVVGMPAVPDLPRPAESALPSELTVAPGKSVSVKLTLQGVPRTPADVRWSVDVPRGMTAKPGYGTVYLWPGANYTVTISLTATSKLSTGRYDVPIAVTSRSQAITDAYVLVSVVRPGGSLSAHPIVLYAADNADMAIAAQISRDLALPAGDVTGSYSQAWKDVSGNKALVLAVGQPAANALYLNVCGWTDPAGWPAGSTPFYYLGYPLRNPPGRDFFELASNPTQAGVTLMTTQLTQYALTGSFPDYGTEPIAATPPALSCQGAPNVTVP